MKIKKPVMISLKYKMTFYLYLSSIIVLLLIRFILPFLLEKEFRANAQDNYLQTYSMMISLFQEDHHVWGNEGSANQFFQEMANTDIDPIDEVMQFNPASRPGDAHPYVIGMTDQNGHILIPFRGHSLGDTISDYFMKKGEAIKIEGRVVAYAFPYGTPPIPFKDKILLKRVNEIIDFGFQLALLIALIFGFILGTGITRKIRTLTSTAESLKEGLKGQQITEIHSHDEIGILARVLNEMSLELEKSHRKIKEMAIVDELTQLNNRRFFNEQVQIFLSTARRKQQSLSLVIGDIDFFKNVNDRFSHLTGDQVLQKIAEIMKENIRKIDLLARFGGEEFIIALPDTGSDQALFVIERIRKQIEDYQWETISSGLRVTMSFGFCTEIAPENFNSLLALADKRLYKAKETGRNKIVFND